MGSCGAGLVELRHRPWNARRAGAWLPRQCVDVHHRGEEADGVDQATRIRARSTNACVLTRSATYQGPCSSPRRDESHRRRRPLRASSSGRASCLAGQRPSSRLRGVPLARTRSSLVRRRSRPSTEPLERLGLDGDAGHDIAHDGQIDERTPEGTSIARVMDRRAHGLDA